MTSCRSWPCSTTRRSAARATTGAAGPFLEHDDRAPRRRPGAADRDDLHRAAGRVGRACRPTWPTPSTRTTRNATSQTTGRCPTAARSSRSTPTSATPPTRRATPSFVRACEAAGVPWQVYSPPQQPRLWLDDRSDHRRSPRHAGRGCRLRPALHALGTGAGRQPRSGHARRRPPRLLRRRLSRRRSVRTAHRDSRRLGRASIGLGGFRA